MGKGTRHAISRKVVARRNSFVNRCSVYGYWLNMIKKKNMLFQSRTKFTHRLKASMGPWCPLNFQLTQIILLRWTPLSSICTWCPLNFQLTQIIHLRWTPLSSNLYVPRPWLKVCRLEQCRLGRLRYVWRVRQRVERGGVVVSGRVDLWVSARYRGRPKLCSASRPRPTSLSHTNIFPSPIFEFVGRFLNIDNFLLLRGNQ